MMFEAVFWASLLLIFYHYLAYPLLLELFARGRDSYSGGAAADAIMVEALPSVTMIVPAHNEAAVIRRKIENCDALEYPFGRIKFVLAFDGCTDDTVNIAHSALNVARRRGAFSLEQYDHNIGKIAVLNAQIPVSEGDIIALTDASAQLDTNALLESVRYFSDPLVGVVTGRYSVEDTGNTGENTYWRYQTRLKANEGTLGAPMGAHGAFYAFRRKLWTPLPADTINDDFVIPMRMVLEGCRAVYAPGVIIRELERTRPRHEFRRRMRIGAGNLQQAVRLAALCRNRQRWVAFMFISGKGLRGVLPLLLITMFCATVALALEGHTFYRSIFILQMAILGVSAAASAFPTVLQVGSIQRLSYFVQGHIALTLGALLWIARQERRVWGLSRLAKIAPE